MDTSGSMLQGKKIEQAREACRAVMNNLREICEIGVQLTEEDRLVSWLPFYHDMGLVGMVLAPMAAQVSVDFLSPRDFAMVALVFRFGRYGR